MLSLPISDFKVKYLYHTFPSCLYLLVAAGSSSLCGGALYSCGGQGLPSGWDAWPLTSVASLAECRLGSWRVGWVALGYVES